MPDSTDIRELFKSPTELLTGDDEQVDWIWPGYLTAGSLTLLVGREKAGKSTLLFGLMNALSFGATFIGQQCQESGAVYLGEEGPLSIGEKLLRFGVGRTDRLRIMDRRGKFVLRKWPVIVKWATIVAKENHMGVLIVDTFGWWADLGPDEENDAGAVRTALEPLLEATSQGLAVLVVHHGNKATGDSRGSTAIAATADIIARLGLDDKKKNRRVINAIGRYQAVPDELICDLEGNTYTYVGTRTDISSDGRKDSVAKGLSNDWQTAEDISSRTQTPKVRVAEALGTLMQEGIVESMGRGVRGEPFMYRLKLSSPPIPAVDSDERS